MADTDLKVGGSKDFSVGDQTLHVRPIPYGNLKKILRMVFELSNAFTDKDVKTIPDVLDRYLDKIFPLLFKASEHSFMTPEWVDENLDIPTMREIIDAAIIVNGIKDFFPKGAAGKVAENLNKNPTTPPENHGSTTSSGLPTDGGPQK